LLVEPRSGSLPTIVLGGFVPDSTEQAFLVRSVALRRGSVYYLNYPRSGFSVDMICAQLDDLVSDLALRRGQPPVILGVSFGAGLALEWMRRNRAGGQRELAGLVLVSPVACAADILDPNRPKATTLLGRALQPYFQPSTRADAALIEKSRTMFVRMFESGAQNRDSLRTLLTAEELDGLRRSVLTSLHAIDLAGARERVEALCRLEQPGESGSSVRPLTRAPALILYAEKESAVLTDNSPTRRLFETGPEHLLPGATCQVVTSGASPVQHASLIFHYFEFLPPLAEFYRRIKPCKLRQAA
jgi:pimeloyl-ACP methyl ester carboxylesterase